MTTQTLSPILTPLLSDFASADIDPGMSDAQIEASSACQKCLNATGPQTLTMSNEAWGELVDELESLNDRDGHLDDPRSRMTIRKIAKAIGQIRV